MRPALAGELTAHGEHEQLDPTSRLILEEARRRGITTHVLSPRAEYFRLEYGPRAVVCRESLSELTSAVALSRCDDKRVTSSLLREAGLRVPAQQVAGNEADDLAFLARHGRIVVKPARGEQGKGVSVGIGNAEGMAAAIAMASVISNVVLLEELVEGDDLRVIVIDGQVVAAASRCPPQVVGDGERTIETLIEAQSQRRFVETAGEGRIPLDGETRRCVGEAGYALTDVLPLGQPLTVRKAANVHTGGTICDVTDRLHPELTRVACEAARVLDIPVVGLDLMVPSLDKPSYAIIEANERPGLANHEPAPTAQRFVDFLFPETVC